MEANGIIIFIYTILLLPFVLWAIHRLYRVVSFMCYSYINNPSTFQQKLHHSQWHCYLSDLLNTQQREPNNWIKCAFKQYHPLVIIWLTFKKMKYSIASTLSLFTTVIAHCLITSILSLILHFTENFNIGTWIGVVISCTTFILSSTFVILMILRHRMKYKVHEMIALRNYDSELSKRIDTNIEFIAHSTTDIKSLPRASNNLMLLLSVVIAIGIGLNFSMCYNASKYYLIGVSISWVIDLFAIRIGLILILVLVFSREKGLRVFEMCKLPEEKINDLSVIQLISSEVKLTEGKAKLTESEGKSELIEVRIESEHQEVFTGRPSTKRALRFDELNEVSKENLNSNSLEINDNSIINPSVEDNKEEELEIKQEEMSFMEREVIATSPHSKFNIEIYCSPLKLNKTKRQESLLKTSPKKGKSVLEHECDLIVEQQNFMLNESIQEENKLFLITKRLDDLPQTINKPDDDFEHTTDIKQDLELEQPKNENLHKRSRSRCKKRGVEMQKDQLIYWLRIASHHKKEEEMIRIKDLLKKLQTTNKKLKPKELQGLELLEALKLPYSALNTIPVKRSCSNNKSRKTILKPPILNAGKITNIWSAYAAGVELRRAKSVGKWKVLTHKEPIDTRGQESSSSQREFGNEIENNAHFIKIKKIIDKSIEKVRGGFNKTCKLKKDLKESIPKELIAQRNIIKDYDVSDKTDKYTQ